MSGTTPAAVDASGDDISSGNKGNAKYWPIERSMYVTVFKGASFFILGGSNAHHASLLPLLSDQLPEAISTVLQYEAFLFCDAEIFYLQRLDKMDVDALYILIRLSLRKHGWHRQSDYQRYADQLGGKLERVETARQILCNRPESEGNKSTIKMDSKSSGASRDVPIDLTCDSEDESPISERVPSTVQSVVEALDENDDLTYHALSCEDAKITDLLEMMSSKELEDLARQLKVVSSSKKRSDLITELLRQSSTQATLPFFNKFKPLKEVSINLKDHAYKNTLGSRLRDLCKRVIVQCIRINNHVVSLIRRVNLIFFRNITHEEQMFVPAILVACKKRRYSLYKVARTNHIFRDRDSLLQYESALSLEQEVDAILSLSSWNGGRRNKVVVDKQDAETQIIEYHQQVMELYKDALLVRTDQRKGLERFEAGYVYTRLLHHMAQVVGKAKGFRTELALLETLLRQQRWLPGKRGSWYDRMACIYMKNMKDKQQVARAYDVVTRALLDSETRLRYRPKLLRRLTKLEKAMNISMKERHTSEASLTKCEDVYIMGERLDKPAVPVAPTPNKLTDFFSLQEAVPTLTRRESGRTSWRGEGGETVCVEQFAIEHYARKGFKGKHSEGRLTRFIFSLLFHDILFHPMNGAFETQYQTSPLDLELDIFYNARRGMIDARLGEIMEGKATEIVSRVDDAHRESKTFFVGSQWDNFSREEILEIIECLPNEALREICLQQAQDFGASGGGVPDLIVWNMETKEARFVEVKSPSDKLSETQKLWIHALREASTIVEVCHVETLQDRGKRLKKGKGKKARSESIETNDRKSRARSMVDVESDADVWADMDIIDLELLELSAQEVVGSKSEDEVWEGIEELDVELLEPVLSRKRGYESDDDVRCIGEIKRRKSDD